MDDRSQLVTKFTDAERDRIFEESRRILSDEPRAPPAPRPEAYTPVSIEPVDAIAKWAAEADAADREREANRARMRREERAAEAAALRTRQDSAELEQRLSSIEARLDVIEQHLEAFNAVANGTMTFSNAVTERLEELASLANKAGVALETMRMVHAREVGALRDRLAASEASHSRETAMLVKELSDARREIDVRNNLREHAANRMAVAGVNETLENVVSLVREDIAARKR
jgi:hypothetical protein